LEVLACATDDDDAQGRFRAERIERREDTGDQVGVIGVVYRGTV
jgi:hypothetical protein